MPSPFPGGGTELQKNGRNEVSTGEAKHWAWPSDPLPLASISKKWDRWGMHRQGDGRVVGSLGVIQPLL